MKKLALLAFVLISSNAMAHNSHGRTDAQEQQQRLNVNSNYNSTTPNSDNSPRELSYGLTEVSR